MRSFQKNRKIFPLLLFFLVILLPFFLIVLFQRQKYAGNAAGNTTVVTIDLTKPAGIIQFGTGVSHTQDDIAFSGNSQSVASAKQYYQQGLVYQNAYIMGWGPGDPEPSPGTYDFSTLDLRVQLMQQTGAKSVISFCCSPGWMRTSGYQNDWVYLTVAPDPSHVADFAQLAAAVAKRYPQVKYFQVWNELKGMWGTDPGATPGVGNRWDYERYTKLYNAVWDAVKAVRPDALIGGPYIGLDGLSQRELDVISYWLANKRGADFVVLDGGTTDFNGSYFPTLVNWVHQQPGGANLPVVWAEWYSRVSQLNNDANYYNAVYANDVIATIQSGALWGLMWGTTGGSQGIVNDKGLPELMLDNQGQATPLYNSMLVFKTYFGAGTTWYQTSVNPQTLSVLATKAKTMIVNQLSTLQTVSVSGLTLQLNPYEVRVIDTPGNVASVTPSSSTPSVTPTVSLTNTPIPQNTSVSLTIGLHGLGSAGDNINPQGKANLSPKHSTRSIKVIVSDTQNNPVPSSPFSGQINYDAASGLFKTNSPVSLGSLQTGGYQIKLQSDGFLVKIIPNVIHITQGQIANLPQVNLVNADINNDNLLNINDYGVLVDCFGSKQSLPSCTHPPTQQSAGADIDDDGTISGTDYNLFLRELGGNKN